LKTLSSAGLILHHHALIIYPLRFFFCQVVHTDLRQSQGFHPPFCASHVPPLTMLCHTTQVVGIVLAIVSGILIGSSFVLKKKGLLRSQAGHTAGEGVAYLKSVRHFPFSLFGV
jgi:Magnesium transporter NIPA